MQDSAHGDRRTRSDFMIPLSLHQFARIIDAALLDRATTTSSGSITISNVAVHSRRIRSQAAFFAIEGSRDGHEFVLDALDGGALVAVVAESRVDEYGDVGLPIFVVPSPLAALQSLAAWHRDQLDADVIVVVGSSGKTMTKDAIVRMMQGSRRVYGSPGSFNSQLGVALAVLDCPPDAEVAVFELGHSSPGELARLMEVVRPRSAVVTNIGTRWASRFGGSTGLTDAFMAALADLPSDGWLLLDPSLTELADYSLRNLPPVYVADRDDDLPSIIETSTQAGITKIQLNFPSARSHVTVKSFEARTDFDISVFRLATDVAWLEGVRGNELDAAVQSFAPGDTRLRIRKTPTGVTAIAAPLNLEPSSLQAVIRTGRAVCRTGGRLLIILPELRTSVGPNDAFETATALFEEGHVIVRGVQTPWSSSVAEEAIARFPSAEIALGGSSDSVLASLQQELASDDVVLGFDETASARSSIVDSLFESMSVTRLYLDLTALVENVAAFRELVGPNVRIMAMVKALAYGTDAVTVSKILEETGVDSLGVATVAEGVELRSVGVSRPIAVMLASPDEVAILDQFDLQPVVYSEEMLESILRYKDGHRDRILPIHLEVDTGMHRTGFGVPEAKRALTRIETEPTIELFGLMTHFAAADDPMEDEFTRSQVSEFEEVLRFAHGLGLNPIAHAGATAAAIRFPSARFDLVRIGLGLYGLHPSPATALALDLNPVVSLVSRVVQIRRLEPGERVGYGGTYSVGPDGAVIAIVPAGYHDCVPRAFSNHGYVVVGGSRCPIVGIISMDSMAINITAVADVAVGSEVLIYGRRGNSTVALEEVSANIGTIPYEILARVGSRVPRIFTWH